MWHTAESAQAQWPDAPTGDELDELLAVARSQVEAYAPVLPAPGVEGVDVVPVSYRVAQLMQAKALFTAKQTGPGDTLGPEGQTVRVYPMDWQVKSILRPTAGMPRIG